SSRRRHTRSTRDWSSDVCSSDLQRWVEAGTPLLDKPKMETRRVGDRLEVSRDSRGSPRFKALHVLIGSGNRRKLPLRQIRDCLKIGRASCRERVWVGGCAEGVA